MTILAATIGRCNDSLSLDASRGGNGTKARNDDEIWYDVGSGLGGPQWRAAVDESWGLESESSGEGKAWERRRAGYRRCGEWIEVERCGGCGEGREASGTFVGVKRSCRCRSCPSCSWSLAAGISAWLQRRFEATAPMDGYRFRYLVLTLQATGEAPGVESLRGDVCVATRLCKAAWKVLGAAEGAGAYRRTEISRTGNVHVNIIYWGPRVDLEVLRAKLLEASPRRAGWVWAMDIDRSPNAKNRWGGNRVKDPRGSKAGLKRVVEYVCKGLDHGAENRRLAFDESWVANEKGRHGLMSPRLAAMWEMASYRQQLGQRFGSFRGGQDPERIVEDPEVAEEKRTKAAETRSCDHCGEVGNWVTQVWPTQRWISYCHGRGKAAMRGSYWKLPPWFRPDKKTKPRVPC